MPFDLLCFLLSCVCFVLLQCSEVKTESRLPSAAGYLCTCTGSFTIVSFTHVSCILLMLRVFYSCFVYVLMITSFVIDILEYCDQLHGSSVHNKQSHKDT